MRAIIISILLAVGTVHAIAQIKGNGKIITRDIDIGPITELIANLHAEIIIDHSAESYMTITADENIIKYINTDVNNGAIDINQREWIQSSDGIIIHIGAPQLHTVENDAHDRIVLTDFDGDLLTLSGNIGEIKASGKVENLIIDAKSGQIDASDLIAQRAEVIITGDAQVIVHPIAYLDIDLTEYARLQLVHQPESMSAAARAYFDTPVAKTNEKLRWINFKLKNNSWRYQKLVVVGPKSNGGTFSYGFAMMPGRKKSERWSIGTKVYKKLINGEKKELLTIAESDENKTIDIFKE